MYSEEKYLCRQKITEQQAGQDCVE